MVLWNGSPNVSVASSVVCRKDTPFTSLATPRIVFPVASAATPACRNVPATVPTSNAVATCAASWAPAPWTAPAGSSHTANTRVAVAVAASCIPVPSPRRTGVLQASACGGASRGSAASWCAANSNRQPASSTSNKLRYRRRVQHRISIAREQYKFSCAHMTVFSDGTKERLHGHNYTLAVALEVSTIELAKMIPFAPLKDAMRELCAAWKEHVLLAKHNPHFTIVRDDRELEFTLCGDRYVLLCGVV